MLGQWGQMVSLERINQGADEAVAVEYEAWSMAKEAQNLMNYAWVRGKIARCLLRSDLKAIKQSMLTGHRLVIESLDVTLDSRGLFDACSLFGQVLDCKVELNAKQQSSGYGFVHYAQLEDAKKATQILHNMQIGDSMVTVRPFEWKDQALFTGCHYSTHRGTELAVDATSYMPGMGGLGASGLAGMEEYQTQGTMTAFGMIM